MLSCLQSTSEFIFDRVDKVLTLGLNVHLDLVVLVHHQSAVSPGTVSLETLLAIAHKLWSTTAASRALDAPGSVSTGGDETAVEVVTSALSEPN